jgi:hypothetical protein
MNSGSSKKQIERMYYTPWHLHGLLHNKDGRRLNKRRRRREH